MIYAISDIHAHTDLYKKFKKDLKEEDEVFVLGDTIDKGDGTIEVLTDILEDERFTLLLGNHEVMMIDYLLRPTHIKYMRWCYNNDGLKTLKSFLGLAPSQQVELKKRILNLPVQLELPIGERTFLLSHAYCLKKGNKLHWNLPEIKESERVWFRKIPNFIEDRIVVNGHTPVQYINYFHEIKEEPSSIFKEVNNNSIWYDIDCGLATHKENKKLGVLELTTLNERYYF